MNDVQLIKTLVENNIAYILETENENCNGQDPTCSHQPVYSLRLMDLDKDYITFDYFDQETLSKAYGA